MKNCVEIHHDKGECTCYNTGHNAGINNLDVVQSDHLGLYTGKYIYISYSISLLLKSPTLLSNKVKMANIGPIFISLDLEFEACYYNEIA